MIYSNRFESKSSSENDLVRGICNAGKPPGQLFTLLGSDVIS
jgi:hypothetical protein